MRKLLPAGVLAATLCSLSFVASARADASADLKQKLAGLDARQPVKARVEYALSNTRGGDDDEGKSEPAQEARVSARVEAGPAGLSILWSREQIAEASERGGKKPVRRALDALTAMHVNDYLNGAPELLRNLEHAELTGVSDDTLDRQPVRLLTFRLNPPMREKDRKYIKQLDTSAKIWLDADGFPLAAESQVHVKGRALLVISFEQTEHEEYRFQHHGDRPIVVRHVKESSGSGGGENHAQKSTATVTLEG